jgi:hypothetical protein
MPKYSSKIGDVFCVPLNNGTKKYFQYIISDMEMLNSSVIRVFKKFYKINENPKLSDIVKDEVDFYAHVIIQGGVNLKLWEKVGNIAEVGKINVLFRDCQDYGEKRNESRIEISERWRVWKINEPMKFVGKLEGENRKAELGYVIPAYSILERIRTGKYNMTHPGYDENSIMTYVPSIEGEIVRKILEKALEEKMAKINARKKK